MLAGLTERACLVVKIVLQILLKKSQEMPGRLVEIGKSLVCKAGPSMASASGDLEGP